MNLICKKYGFVLYFCCMTVKDIQKKTIPIFTSFGGVKRAMVFGSVARCEDTALSDVDILVEMTHPVGLIAFARLRYTLADALGREVDLVKSTMIKPSLQASILSDVKEIYAST